MEALFLGGILMGVALSSLSVMKKFLKSLLVQSGETQLFHSSACFPIIGAVND
jgi:hypothetical protein